VYFYSFAITVYPVLFACHKFCENRVNLYIFYFAEVIFCDLEQLIGIFIAHNYEYNKSEN
jgi:hypothetical protein